MKTPRVLINTVITRDGDLRWETFAPLLHTIVHSY